MDESIRYQRAVRGLMILALGGCMLAEAPADTLLFDIPNKLDVAVKPDVAVVDLGSAFQYGHVIPTDGSLHRFLAKGWESKPGNRKLAAPSDDSHGNTTQNADSLADLIRGPKQPSQNRPVPSTSASTLSAPKAPIPLPTRAKAESIGSTTSHGSITSQSAADLTELVPTTNAEDVELRPLRTLSRTEISDHGQALDGALDPDREINAEEVKPAEVAANQPNDAAPSSDVAEHTLKERQAFEELQEGRQSKAALDLPKGIESDRVRDSRLRNAAGAAGFGMLALDRIEPPVTDKVSAFSVPVATTTIHETRLRELSREAIHTAVKRLTRGATHSARKSTIEALGHIVAVLDARQGANHHAQRLSSAFDSIRESEEFMGSFGTVDHETLSRMVAVHKTTILKGRPLDEYTALQAIESYLSVAQEDLVAASGSMPEASDALVLMGKIEKKMGGSADTHAAAVALTYHRAAVAVDPYSAIARRELGKTLLTQGLIQQAASEFAQVVETQPTRDNFRLLLEASRKMGDIDTVRQCQKAINDPRLISSLPVRHLDAKTFAATYKPKANEMPPETASTRVSKDAGSDTGEARRNTTISARKETTSTSNGRQGRSGLSQFKSWLPKFRRE